MSQKTLHQSMFITESMFIEIDNKKRRNIIIGVNYRPPNSNILKTS